MAKLHYNNAAQFENVKANILCFSKVYWFMMAIVLRIFFFLKNLAKTSKSSFLFFQKLWK